MHTCCTHACLQLSLCALHHAMLFYSKCAPALLAAAAAAAAAASSAAQAALAVASSANARLQARNKEALSILLMCMHTHTVHNAWNWHALRHVHVWNNVRCTYRMLIIIHKHSDLIGALGMMRT